MSEEAKADELKAIAKKILECAPLIAQYPFLLDRIESNTLEEVDGLIILCR